MLAIAVLLAAKIAGAAAAPQPVTNTPTIHGVRRHGNPFEWGNHAPNFRWIMVRPQTALGFAPCRC